MDTCESLVKKMKLSNNEIRLCLFKILKREESNIPPINDGKFEYPVAVNYVNLSEDLQEIQFVIPKQYYPHQDIGILYFLNNDLVHQTYEELNHFCIKISQESWSILYHKDIEAVKNRNQNFCNKHTDILPEYRSVLLDWLIDICTMYKFHRETYYLAMDYFDSYVSLCAPNSIMKNDLQLLGLASLLIATKMEETKALPMEDIIFLCDGIYTIKQVLHSEMSLIEMLDGKCNRSTANMWLLRFIHIVNRKITQEEYNLCTKLLDIATLDLQYLEFPSCVIAATCLKLVLFEEVIVFSAAELTAKRLMCSKWLKKYWREIRSRNNSKEREDATSNLYVSDCCPCFPHFSLIQSYSSNLEIFEKVRLDPVVIDKKIC